VAAPKILPRPGGRGCAKNPADRNFTLSSRFAFHRYFDQRRSVRAGMLASPFETCCVMPAALPAFDLNTMGIPCIFFTDFEGERREPTPD
jgi:hypothetical protein